MSKRNTLSPNVLPLMDQILNRKKSVFDFWLNPDSMRAQNELLSILNEHNPSKVSRLSNELARAVTAHEREYFASYQTLSFSEKDNIFKIALNRIPALAIIWSVAPSGFVREEAVKTIAKINGPFELALLLVRLNDWVPEIRKAASLKIDKLIKENEINEDCLTDCLGLLLSMPKLGRMTGRERTFIKELLQLVDRKSPISKIVLMSKEDKSPQYLRLGLQQGIFTGELENIALNAKHPQARWIATRALFQASYAWHHNNAHQKVQIESKADLIELAKKGLEDKSPTIKQLSLDFIIDKQPRVLFQKETFVNIAFSRHVSLLDRAEFGLRKLGINMVDEARSMITEPHLEGWAVKVLGRYGTNEDGELLFNVAKNRNGDDKISALTASAQRNYKLAILELESIAINHQEHEVARQASGILNRLGYKMDFQIIHTAILTSGHAKRRGYLLSMPKHSTMKLARLIVAMKKAEIEENYERLMWLLARKRNTGAFTPDATDISALKLEVSGLPETATEISDILGIELLER